VFWKVVSCLSQEESKKTLLKTNNAIFLLLEEMVFEKGIKLPGKITIVDLLKEGTVLLSQDNLEAIKDKDLGYIVFAEIGELVLWEVDENSQCAIYAPSHRVCSGVAIKARRGDKVIIGHAHLKPTTSVEDKDKPDYFREIDDRGRAGTVFIQFKKVISFLLNQPELSEIEMVITTESVNAYGMPSATRVKKFAEKKGVSIRRVPRDTFYVADVLSTETESIFRVWPFQREPSFKIVSSEW